MMPGGLNMTELFNFTRRGPKVNSFIVINSRSHKPGAYIADKIKKNSRDLDIFLSKKNHKYL